MGLLAWSPEPGEDGLLLFPGEQDDVTVPGMVLWTGGTERGPRDPEGDTSRELYMGDLIGVATGQLIRFSFCRRLQNQTLTTSFSMDNCSAIMEISSELGLGLS